MHVSRRYSSLCANLELGLLCSMNDRQISSIPSSTVMLSSTVASVSRLVLCWSLFEGGNGCGIVARAVPLCDASCKS